MNIVNGACSAIPATCSVDVSVRQVTVVQELCDGNTNPVHREAGVFTH